MRHDLNLNPHSGNLPSLQFGWDDETGDIWGKDAQYILHMAENARKNGEVPLHPYPDFYPVNDPLRSKEEFAALLGFSYQLPAFLTECYPSSDNASSDDVVY